MADIVHYTQEMKQKAYQLFLADIPLLTISEQINAEFNVNTSVATLRTWKKNSSWDLAKDSIEADALRKIRTKQITKTMQRTEEHIDAYNQLEEKAKDALFGQQKLNFTNASDATKALDIAIQGERKISGSMINLAFVEDIFMAVLDVIKDEDQRDLIGQKLKKIIALYSQADEL